MGLYTTERPIYIHSLGGDFNAWFDMDGARVPTDKQLMAWTRFCNINPNEMKEIMRDGLIKLTDKMDVLPNHTVPELGPIYKPIVISSNAKRAMKAIRLSRKTLGKSQNSPYNAVRWWCRYKIKPPLDSWS